MSEIVNGSQSNSGSSSYPTPENTPATSPRISILPENQEEYSRVYTDIKTLENIKIGLIASCAGLFLLALVTAFLFPPAAIVFSASFTGCLLTLIGTSIGQAHLNGKLKNLQ
ncbi:MAG: hypothetical protein S4CHLAM20_10560 [Chlamydiia bacterium]|nr:hypothetical protein [Chlamydiia bacterium]